MNLGHITRQNYCKQHEIEDSYLKQVCAYIVNPFSTINNLVKRNKKEERKANTKASQSLNNKDIRIVPPLLQKNHNKAFKIRLEYPFPDLQEKKCKTKHNQKNYASRLKGSLYALTYYSILRGIIDNDLMNIEERVKTYNIKETPLYLSQRQYNNKSVGINLKPVDLISANVENLIDSTFLQTIRSSDLLNFLRLAESYKTLYIESLKRLYKEEQFINFFDSSPNIYSHPNYLSNNEIYPIIDECYDQDVYMHFSYNNETTYWVINLHTYLYSFWLRRDLEGTLNSADKILKRFIKTMSYDN